MTDLLTNVERDYVHVAGDDLRSPATIRFTGVANESSPYSAPEGELPPCRGLLDGGYAFDGKRSRSYHAWDEEYGNAIGICLIHAVISANDAVTINFVEVRS